MRPGLHLTNPKNESFYRFICHAAVVGDVVKNGNRYEMLHSEDDVEAYEHTPWLSWEDEFPATTITLRPRLWRDVEEHTIIAAVGIEFGRPGAGGAIRYTKYSGAAKILITG